jgi:hypothetical protein
VEFCSGPDLQPDTGTVQVQNSRHVYGFLFFFSTVSLLS